MSYIPDNYDMFCRHEAEQQAELDKLPECCECGEPIQQETAVYINGKYICDGCLEGLRQSII